MTFNILFQVFLFGIALSIDAFAVSITDGLIYTNINKKKAFFIAFVFGLMQAIMPLIGYWLIELISFLAGASQGSEIGKILSTIISWIAFALLIFIGSKMIISSLLNMKKPLEEKNPKLFSYKEVLLMGVVTSIDAFATGVAFHSGLSNNVTIWLHVSIILACTFIISLLGVLLARQLQKIFKGRYEIAQIVGGAILLLLAIWVILSHYLGI